MTPDDPFKRGAFPDGDARITADNTETARLDDSVGVQGAPSPGNEFTRAPESLSSPRNPENDPVSDLPDIDTGMPGEDPDYRQAQEGRLVFKPGELNNAGEDKEYFHPKKDHHFEVPQDANNHALAPDVQVAPGNTVKTIK